MYLPTYTSHHLVPFPIHFIDSSLRQSKIKGRSNQYQNVKKNRHLRSHWVSGRYLPVSHIRRKLLTPFLIKGGSIAKTLLQNNQVHNHQIVAITRNTGSPSSVALAKAGAELVQADMNSLPSLKTAVKNANIIFAVTDFISAGSIKTETQHGLNMLDAALTTLDTLELFIWSNLPDARKQKVPYKNVIHFNAKNDIAERMWASKLGRVMMEVRLGPYFENMIKAPQVYGPQKVYYITLLCWCYRIEANLG